MKYLIWNNLGIFYSLKYLIWYEVLYLQKKIIWFDLISWYGGDQVNLIWFEVQNNDLRRPSQEGGRISALHGPWYSGSLQPQQASHRGPDVFHNYLPVTPICAFAQTSVSLNMRLSFIDRHTIIIEMYSLKHVYFSLNI